MRKTTQQALLISKEMSYSRPRQVIFDGDRQIRLAQKVYTRLIQQNKYLRGRSRGQQLVEYKNKVDWLSLPNKLDKHYQAT